MSFIWEPSGILLRYEGPLSHPYNRSRTPEPYCISSSIKNAYELVSKLSRVDYLTLITTNHWLRLPSLFEGCPLAFSHSLLMLHYGLRRQVRSLPIRKGDEVVVVRGAFKNREGKVETCYRRKFVIHIERITREKANGKGQCNDRVLVDFKRSTLCTIPW